MNRHDPPAHFVGCAMQRKGEAKLRGLVGKLANLRRESAGRNGDVPGTDAETPRRVDDANRAQNVFQVGERLAHAHEDDVIDFFAALLFNLDELLHDLACIEIAGPAVQSAGAKFAAVSAADLAGDTNGPAIRGLDIECGRRGNEERFDQDLVALSVEKYLRVVFR